MRSLSLALWLCGTAAAQTVSTSASSPSLRLLSESELPDLTDSFESQAGLVKAAKKTRKYLERTAANPSTPRYFKIGDRDYSTGILLESIDELLDILNSSPTATQLAEQVRARFDVFQSVGTDGNGRVVFSSYYQPMLSASRTKSEKYPYPLYKRPPDMVEVDLSAFDAKKYSGETLLGRLGSDRRVVPYFSRGDIDIRKKLAGKGLEVAWLRDKFDSLDLHIQGSGILKFPDGKEVLARYAATNGLTYNSVGLTLVKAGVFSQSELTRDKLKEYLRSQSGGGADWILASNPRFTFFELAPLPADGEPFGTLNESLTPSRSIAIDPALFPLGALAFFSTTSPQADKDGNLLGQFPNSRYALCMDTGGAIKGPGRVDIYVGHGKQAAAIAPAQWNEGKLYILLKKVPPRDR